MPLTQGQRDAVQAFFTGFGPQLVAVQDVYLHALNLIAIYDAYPAMAGTVSDPEMAAMLGNNQTLGAIRSKLKSTLQAAVAYVDASVTP